MQVLRVCSFSTFALSPALPPCYCPLAFRHQVRQLTSSISSESYPGSPECVVRYHGADRFANSIRALFLHLFPSDEEEPSETGRRWVAPPLPRWLVLHMTALEKGCALCHDGSCALREAADPG